MRNYLNQLPKDLRDLIYKVSEFASHRKISAYLVGGVVRDLILDYPNLDLDIVIQDGGLKFANAFAQHINARVITHSRFQTATLVTSKRIKLDIATCRSEYYPSPASLPVVNPGATIREDLARRDFTINALAIDLIKGSFGTLIDLYQGRKDLEVGAVRILHDLSFIDDPTRIIRAVRFEQRLGFRIEPHSLKLLKQAAAMGILKRLSPHRLRDEIILILKEPLALRCIVRLNKLIGLDFIHQQIKLNKSNLEYLESINKEITWFNNNFPNHKGLDSWLMYLIGLLNRLNEGQMIKLSRKLGLRKSQTDKAISYRKFSAKHALRLSKKDALPSQIYRYLEPLSTEVILLIKAKSNNKFLGRNINRFLKYYSNVGTYIRGEDLNKLGLKPSQNYKKILRKLLYLQLDKKIRSRKQALKYVARLCR